MDAGGERRAAALARIDGYIAMERRHIAEMTATLEKVTRLGWAEGVDHARDLLDLSRGRLARLIRERTPLAGAAGQAIPPDGAAGPR